MTVKTITQPLTGQTFKLGRRAPVARGPRLSLGNYLLKTLPTPPAAVDYSQKAGAILADILGNENLGDCVCAMVYHVGGVMLANADKPVPYKRADAIDLYVAACGYKRGDPNSDQGCDETAVLNYWKEKGIPGDANKIAGWLAIDGSNWSEVQTALWLFENLCFGVSLPDAWINPMPSGSGFTWDVAGASDPNNGHAFAGVGYDASGVKIDTWGMLGTITPAAIAEYTSAKANGGLYAVLSQDAISKATAKAPNGFDFSQLQADLDSFA